MSYKAKPSAPVLAVDIGGTKILAAVVSPEYEVLADSRVPTNAAGGPGEVIARIKSSINDVLREACLDVSQVDSISLAAAGAVSGPVLTASPNLPGWRDIALADIVQAEFGARTCLIHDCNAAALAEQRLGAGRGVADFIYVTVSTGIGGGIIIGGKLYTGASGGAGEVGHMTIDIDGPPCPCGNIGCLEMLASGKAVAREAVRRLKNGEKSSLVDVANGNLESITAETVEAAARAGDILARDILARAAYYLGVGFVNLVNVLNPALIVVGGGMSRMGDTLLEPGRRLVRERAFAQSSSVVRIVNAELGDNAGVLGAAIFARQMTEGL